MVRVFAACAIALTLFGLPATGFAQDEAAAEKEAGEAGVIYRKKTIVSFDDDTVDGDLTRPDAQYVESRKRVRHSNLIRIREDFRDRVLDSVSSL